MGKSGKNIDKQKYETLKKAILSALQNKELTHTELFDRLNKGLKGKFSGNISWYGETVKLDLEARKIMKRNSQTSKIPAEEMKRQSSPGMGKSQIPMSKSQTNSNYPNSKKNAVRCEF